MVPPGETCEGSARSVQAGVRQSCWWNPPDLPGAPLWSPPQISLQRDVKMHSQWQWVESPSSPRKGSWRLMALLGRAGTTILLSRSSSFLSHSKSENLRLTLDSFTRNTGRFVCIGNIALLGFLGENSSSADLQSAFVVCVALASDTMCDWVDHLRRQRGWEYITWSLWALFDLRVRVLGVCVMPRFMKGLNYLKP